MAGVHSSFPSERTRSTVVTDPFQLRFHAFTRPPTKHTDELLLLPTFSKRAHTKPNSLGHRFSGTAFGWSSFLTFVSRRSPQLRSAPPVNPARAALLGAYPKTAPRSLPRALGSASLRRLTAPPSLIPPPTMKRMFLLACKGPISATSSPDVQTDDCSSQPDCLRPELCYRCGQGEHRRVIPSGDRTYGASEVSEPGAVSPWPMGDRPSLAGRVHPRETRRKQKWERLRPATISDREILKIRDEHLRPMNQGLDSLLSSTSFEHYVDTTYRPLLLPLMAKSSKSRSRACCRTTSFPRLASVLCGTSPLGSCRSTSLSWPGRNLLAHPRTRFAMSCQPCYVPLSTMAC